MAINRSLIVWMPGVVAALIADTAVAGTLVAQIKDRNGNPVQNAVVYAVPVTGRAPAVKPDATAIVEQSYYKFEPFVSVVQVGTKVRFPNRDRTEHHVKVLSGPTVFEHRVYTRREPEAVLLDKPGQVTLQCLIHDWMSAHVYVVDTPWFGKTGKNGSVVIEGVGTGEHNVFVAHPSLLLPGQVTPAMPRRLSFDASTVQVVEARLDLVPKAEPTRRQPSLYYE
ncbi:MAG: methylamine utilization protein [Burkholderiales bacterium]|nr:methylamine utilization protein [Burkholderiales bacterium]